MNTIRICDIQTAEILFFESAREDQCYQFCRERDIDCLPSLEDSGKLFLRDESQGAFVERELGQERCVDGLENIFNPQMLNRFSANPLLFVYTHGDLTGVVHFCDYNKPVVSAHLYESLFAYETNLRELLVRSGLKNLDMLDYFESKAESPADRGRFKRKVDLYRRDGPKSRDLPAFQLFHLEDLIGLAVHKEIMDLSSGTIGLRNDVMHAHEFVNLSDNAADNFIYTFETYAVFFNAVLVLNKDLKRVVNRIAFMRGCTG